MRYAVVALLLAGCASAPPQVVHLTWIKVPGMASKVEVQRGPDGCVILTDDGYVSYAHFGAAFRMCLGD